MAPRMNIRVGPLAVGLLCKAAPRPLYNPVRPCSHWQSEGRLPPSEPLFLLLLLLPAAPQASQPCPTAEGPMAAVLSPHSCYCPGSRLPKFPAYEPTSRLASLQGVTAACLGAAHSSAMLVLAQLAQSTALSPSHRAGNLTKQGGPRTKAKEVHT